MSRPGGDADDYVLIYDGENGLRMAPRAAAAAFEDQDAGELQVAQPSPEAGTRVTSSRGAQVAAVIAVVVGLGGVGFLLGHGVRGPAPARPAAVATAVPTPSAQVRSPHSVSARPPAVAAAGVRRLAKRPPVRHGEAAVRTAARRPIPAIRAAAPAGKCATVRGRAERMICRDPDLTAQDARLKAALNSASQAGVPASQLEDGQTAWVMERNAAARRSRAEVSAAYQRRIEEVETLASQAPPF